MVAQSIEQFLTHLHKVGIKLWVEAGQLRSRAAQDALTPALRAEIAARKADLIAFLQQAYQAQTADSSAIQPAPRTAAIPLSLVQQSLWLLTQIETENTSYNEVGAFQLDGPLQVAALEQALAEIVRRHEALRTTFMVDEQGVPRQVIHPPGFTLPCYDLTQLSDLAQKAEIQRLARQEAEVAFDLEQGPLVRIKLLCLQSNPAAHVLLLAMHHLTGDVWSFGLLLQELATLYAAFVQGEPSPLAELPIQYADYAIWQRKELTGEVFQNQLTYWRAQLKDAPAFLPLPTAPSGHPPRPPHRTYQGQKIHFVIDAQSTQQLRLLAQQSEATLFMLLLAAFNVLLGRYSQQEDILVGAPIANRQRQEVARLIGFFVNTLVLRTRLTGNPTFRSLLEQVKTVTRNAYAHQDISFEQLITALQLPRSLRYSPLFQVMFAFQNIPTLRTADLTGLQIKPLDVEVGLSKYDLTLTLYETDAGLAGNFEYNTDLFASTTIERMIGHFQTLLSGIVANPEQRLSDLPLLSAAERQQLLVEWNNTATDYPKEQCIHQLFEEQVARTPDALAVSFENQSLTYAELNARANQLAHHLQSLGVGPDVLVGICVERSLELVVGLLAILKAGGAYVPLDPAYPPERLAFMLADTAPLAILTQTALRPNLPTTVQPFCLDLDWPLLANQPTHNLVCHTTAEHTFASLSTSLAYVMYTSGSTGRPKGVSIMQRNVVRLVQNTNFAQLTANEVFLQLAPIAFDAATLEIWGALLNGGRLVVMSPGQPTLEAIGETIRRYGVTTLWLTAGLFHLMVDERVDALRPLRQLLTGGDVLSVAHVQRFLQAVPTCQLINGYGPTENTTFTCCYAFPAGVVLGASAPIGRPIAHTQVYILDEQLHPVPIGVTGTLYAGGDGVARGYLNRPELTAEKFISNPFGPKGNPGRLYKTGDLARWLPDGNIEFLGRSDQQVKLRGFRIELGEIEAVLSQHPAVQEAVVIAREDTPAEKRLVAYLVSSQKSKVSSQQSVNELQDDSTRLLPTDSGLLTADSGLLTADSRLLTADSGLLTADSKLLTADLRLYLQTKLPDYMLPSAFVVLDALPLTPNGKVDRKALPAPDRSALSSQPTVDPPATPSERAIADIWATLLGHQPISRHDNFFALGGHSLLATQVVSRIRQALNVQVPLRLLFETATLAAFAAEVDRLRHTTPAAAVQTIPCLARNQALPLSYAQERLWFLEQLGGERHAYNMPMALRLSGKLHSHALAQSLEELVHRHESLRTTFSVAAAEDPAGGPTLGARQVIHAAVFTLPRIDLTACSAAAQASATQRLIAAEMTHAFDLTTGPLFRATLVCLPPGAGDDGQNATAEYLLLLNFHHIIADGWSMEIFNRELAALYTAFCQERPSPLPPLAIQYVDFADWQRKQLTGEVLAGQLAYWQKQLAGAPPLLSLPTDHPRPAVQTYQGAHFAFSLPLALTEAVRGLTSTAGTTLFMTLLAAFKVLLLRYSGQTDLVVGTPIANRQHLAIEPLIGFFVNTLVLRSDLAGNLTFRDLLAQVKNSTLDAYQHQDIPFEKVVEALQPVRSLSHSPLFQVMFNLLQASAWRVTLPDLRMQLVEADYAIAKFDLTLSMVEDGVQLLGLLEYNSDLFARATIQRMAGHFQTLLQGIVDNPDQPLVQLPLLTDTERHQLLVEWASTSSAASSSVAELVEAKDECIHHLFAEQVERTPDAVAVVLTGDQRPETRDQRLSNDESLVASLQQLTYRELNARANQLAHHLQSLGVGPDVLVGICVERSIEMVVGLLGILKAGGAYVPLDPTYPPARLAFMLQDADTSVLLTQTHLQAHLPATKASIVCLDSDWPQIATQSRNTPVSNVQAEQLAYIIYTSGSTGQPKGALNTHGGVCNVLHYLQDTYKLTPADSTLQTTVFSFDVATSELFWPLLNGAGLVLTQTDGQRDSHYLVAMLQRYQITTLHLVPSLLQVLLEEPDITACTSLKRAIVAGEALPVALQARFFARLPHAELHNLYGPSETAIYVTAWHCQPQADQISVPIGRPVTNTQIYVLDRQLQPVPIGVAGELHIGGNQVGRGYHKRPELTEEKFIVNPFGTGRLYKTGDLACWRLGPEATPKIEYLGRIDQQLKLRGFRIELGEIEAVLSQHPGVQEALVIAREDVPGDKRLVAYVVVSDKMTRWQDDKMTNADDHPVILSSPHPVILSDLRSHLQAKLPDYMLPSAFVLLDVLPLTPNGKLDRKALPAPDRSTLSLKATFVAPATATEISLARIWGELLASEQIGIHDSFFALGGHSLLATQIVSRIRQLLAVDLPLRRLFETPTIAGLADFIDSAQLLQTKQHSAEPTLAYVTYVEGRV